MFHSLRYKATEVLCKKIFLDVKNYMRLIFWSLKYERFFFCKKSPEADLLDIDQIIVNFQNVAKKTEKVTFCKRSQLSEKYKKCIAEVGFSESDKNIVASEKSVAKILFLPVAILS